MRIRIACVVAINLLAAGCGSTPDPATNDEIDTAPMTKASVKPAVKPGIIRARNEIKALNEINAQREIKARMLLRLAQHQELRNKKASAKSYQRLLDYFGDTEKVLTNLPNIQAKILELKQQ